MRPPRFAHSAILAVCAAVIAASAAAAAPAGPLPDTTGILTPWTIEPRYPCPNDSVFMVVRGFEATPCDSFLGVERVGPLFVRIRTQVHLDVACFAAPSIFYRVPVPLGRFPAGSHTGTVEVVTIGVHEDGSSTRTAQQYRFGFDVSAGCEIPNPPIPPGLPPYVTSIGIEPDPACAQRPTTLVVKGEFPDGCGSIVDSRVIDPEHVEMTLKPTVRADTACTLSPVPWRQPFDLGLLPAGDHHTDIAVYVLVWDSVSTGYYRIPFHNTFQFWVYGNCDSAPPPLPQPLPYVTHIAIGRDSNCEPICPGAPIPFQVFGEFPHDCLSFKRIELIPSPLEIYPPPPPIVRIIVDSACVRRLCMPGPIAWSAGTRLPGMLPGNYRLQVELAQTACSDSFPPGTLYRTEVPFTVGTTCPESLVCLRADFEHTNYPCDATVSVDQPAVLSFLVMSRVPLAGLQGAFTMEPAQLRISKIEPIGPASDMLLDWAPTATGARFVLLAKHGAPIPVPEDSCVPNCPPGTPVLLVTVAAGRGGIPDQTFLAPVDLLGSDIDGNGVPLCPPPICADRDPRMMRPGARICAGEQQACDFNSDGTADIRDLVLMVHCVNHEGPCPLDLRAYDCDGDSVLAISDVLCCARHILGQPQCPGCPPDSGPVRPEPTVSVTFGAPQASGDGVDLPVQIAGSDRLGAAMLKLDLPLDRYQVSGFDAGGGAGWLTLQQEEGGGLVLGMIDTRRSNRQSVPDRTTFVLHLGLRPGASPGGTVTATAGEFSGPDGVTLQVNLGHPWQTLPGSAGPVLSANQPNPFSSETEFRLDLAQAGEGTVMIYDLRGRVVAVVHRGPLAVGSNVFRWDGRQSDGSAAPNGVYFYQAKVGGQSLARKLILMRGN